MTVSFIYSSFQKDRSKRDNITQQSLIPLEIWIKIFEGFEPQELTKVACVSRQFKVICQHDFLWEKFLLRDFGFYDPSNLKRLSQASPDEDRIRCIVLNVMESHDIERMYAFYYKNRREPSLAQKRRWVDYNFVQEKEDTDDSFCKKYGEIHEVGPNLNEAIPKVLEPIPIEILNRQSFNRFYDLYMQTLQSLQSLPEVKQIKAHTPSYSIRHYTWDTYKPSLGKAVIPRLKFITVFRKECIQSFRNYYRLLGIYRRTLSGQVLKEKENRITNFSKIVYAAMIVFTVALAYLLKRALNN